MRIRLMLLSLFVFLALFLGLISSPAEGDCDAGIKKEHLDTTPGEFVDDVTIEIDATNGLRVSVRCSSRPTV